MGFQRPKRHTRRSYSEADLKDPKSYAKKMILLRVFVGAPLIYIGFSIFYKSVNFDILGFGAYLPIIAAIFSTLMALIGDAISYTQARNNYCNNHKDDSTDSD